MISVTKSFRDININPLHYSVLVIYGLTRFIEYLTNTNQLWSKLWILIVDFFGDDDFSMYFTASTLHSVLFIYWFYGGIYVLFDVTQWPKCIRKYKVRNVTNESMDTKLLIKAARVAFINQITITIPLTYVGYLIIKFRGKNRSFYDVPDFLTVVWQLLICIAVDEILFYYSHRFLHQNPYLYRLVHKKHHEWTAPIAIAASYAHPVEHIISNVLPISLGPVFINAHLSIAWIWHTLAIITTLSNHLGYHLPFLNSPEFHDFHHLKFTGCYGNLGILDRIHGTDQLFRESIHNLRHTTIFSLKSAREKFPDKSS